MKGIGRVRPIVAFNPTISIKRSDGGKLSIEGEHRRHRMFTPGVLGATAVPTQGTIAFAEDGSVPFDQAEEGQCLVPHAARRHVAACGRQHAMRRFHGHLHGALSPRLMRASL